MAASKLVIGTHALIEAPVQFQRLQLAVIDEQHRFGVGAARRAAQPKAKTAPAGDDRHPHPALAGADRLRRPGPFGDGRNAARPPAGEHHVLRPVERERAYTLIQSQVKAGRQAFIIYPLVEQGENGRQPGSGGRA
jgi:ATP-dependent DNA helicase RecG